jgi:putative intracellular protease/amidase
MGLSKRIARLLVAGMLLASVCHGTATAAPGKIVLANDEWTLSNGALFVAPDGLTYALNTANWFTGGGSGNFRVWSANFGLTESDLAAAMTGAGHSWVVSTAGTFDLATVSGYDAVFFAGSYPGTAADIDSVLTPYVMGGGNVYIAAGTGELGPTAEALVWNTFLANFGLALDTVSYNSIIGNIPIVSAHTIMSGVSVLYQNNGNSIIDLDPGDPSNEVIAFDSGQGLYAVWERKAQNGPEVPEPGTTALMIAACSVGSLFALRRRLGK